MDKIDQEMTEIAEKLEKAGKAGEGSRGGKVVGHTRSGKPIYDDHGHEGHAGFSHDDHHDAAQAHHQKVMEESESDKVAHHSRQSDEHLKRTGFDTEGWDAKRDELSSKRYEAEQELGRKRNGFADPLTLKQLRVHHEGPREIHAMTGPKNPKHQANLKAYKESHKNYLDHAIAEEKHYDSHPLESMKADQKKIGALQEARDAHEGKKTRHEILDSQGPEDTAKHESLRAARKASGIERGMAHLASIGHKDKSTPEAQAAKQKHEALTSKHEASHRALEDHENDVVKRHRESEGSPMKKSFESIIETVIAMGPEAMRKALPTLTEDQKVLLSDVLQKAKQQSLSMDDVAGQKDSLELVELESEKSKNKKPRAGEADEALMKPKADDVNHQGDRSQLAGQLIKAKEKGGVPNDENAEREEIDQMESGEAEKNPAEQKAVASEDNSTPEQGKKMKKPIDPNTVVARMQEKGLKKADCLAACEAKGETELAKAVQDNWEVMEKAKSIGDKLAALRARRGQPAEAPIEQEADAEGESDEQETTEQASGKEMAKRAEKKACEMKDAAQPMQKSIPWTEGTSSLLKASTRRGQNAHYTVEDELLKADAEQTETIKKGGYLNEISGEELAKSEGAPSPQFRKSYSQAMIEAGADMGMDQHKRLNKSAPKTGSFSVQSFAEEDLCKSLGISPEQAAEIFGDKKPASGN